MSRTANFLFFFLLIGCSNPYQLPDPPPPEERVSQTEGNDVKESEQNYLEVRATIIQLYNLLEQQRYQEAVALLSKETQDFLTYRSESSPEAVLAEGKMIVEEQVVEFRPVHMLLASNISQLVDALPNVEEQETSNRKEVFAVTEEGAIRIVMIKESGKWVLHRTRLPIPVQTE